ncbi:MAG: hypothetical protein A2103_02670 [Gammaproteobacteria bacterium GWF2_41_13]|nr:MAG: hypothetical protein A2103_02670 [Gammaproteobacteria bacterium GWF2_41_13]
MNEAMLAILACPLCKGQLIFDKEKQRLICRFDKLAYPVDHGIPILLLDAAQPLKEEEIKS